MIFLLALGLEQRKDLGRLQNAFMFTKAPQKLPGLAFEETRDDSEEHGRIKVEQHSQVFLSTYKVYDVEHVLPKLVRTQVACRELLAAQEHLDDP